MNYLNSCNVIDANPANKYKQYRTNKKIQANANKYKRIQTMNTCFLAISIMTVFQQVKGCPTSPCTNADRNARGKAEDDHVRKGILGGAAEGPPHHSLSAELILCQGSP